MYLRILLALLLTTTPALADEVQQQAIGQKLLEEINADLQLRAELIKAKAQIEELKKTCKPDDGAH